MRNLLQWKFAAMFYVCFGYSSLTSLIEEDLFSPTFNVAPMSNVISNSTCGSPPTEWCRYEKNSGVTCGWCNSDKEGFSRKVEYLLEDTFSLWWQSKNNPGVVTISFSFPKTILLYAVVVEPGPLQFPSVWALEKSNDGEHFVTVERFASGSDCDEIENVTCIDGHLTRGISLDRPEIITQVRLVLQKVHHLENEVLENLYSDNFKYYTLKNVKIYGRCTCGNMNEMCVVDDLAKELRCKCLRSLCGDYSVMCCPEFQNISQWAEYCPCPITNNVTITKLRCQCPSVQTAAAILTSTTPSSTFVQKAAPIPISTTPSSTSLYEPSLTVYIFIVLFMSSLY